MAPCRLIKRYLTIHNYAIQTTASASYADGLNGLQQPHLGKEVVTDKSSQGDLLGTVLLKNDNVNLACDNDFNVKFVIKDKCLNCGTYICWAIYVNDWQIHSYETELGGGY